MASTAHVTRDDVIAAIEECRATGTETFLKKTGFGPSTRYVVRYQGRSYPSKAILGVAAGLGPQDVIGGIAHAVRQLLALGFEVRRGQRVLADSDLIDLVRIVEFKEPDPGHRLPVEPVASFASGSNRPGQIRGLGELGVDVGVAAPEVSRPAEQEIHRLAGSDVLVFVDSGAFGEVGVGADGDLMVRKPITDQEWRRRLALYRRIARTLGRHAWLVAPDRVGCQVESLERLERYRAQVLELRELGARVLVPLQRGARSQAAIAGDVTSVLGWDGWIPALPCKKAGTSPAEVSAFLAAVTPAHVHLLGLGPRNRRIREYLESVRPHGATLSLDANWITANVGRRRNGQVRRFTRARDWAGRAGFERASRDRVALLLAMGLQGVLTWSGQVPLFG